MARRTVGTADAANLLLDEDAAAILDEEVGPRKAGVAVRRNSGAGKSSPVSVTTRTS